MRDRFDMILATHRRAVNLRGTRSVTLDLESADRLTGQLRKLAPALVIHTVGMANVEQCEADPPHAEHINVRLAQHVAQATAALGIKLVHISTDHLFSGDKPWVSEEEEPRPLNVYARTKLQAEKLVQQTHPDSLIVRTNFFGWGHAYRQSFSDWVINSLRSDRKIIAFEDAFFTPILIDVLAIAVHEAISKQAVGIYNVVGEQRLSKSDFINLVAERFSLPKTLISRGQIGNSALSASRPHDMSLDNSKFRGLLNRDLGSVEDFLSQLYRQEQQGRAAELKNAVTER